eukprot:11896380-Alexandrium_andersonii.AAC.1
MLPGFVPCRGRPPLDRRPRPRCRSLSGHIATTPSFRRPGELTPRNPPSDRSAARSRRPRARPTRPWQSI